MVRGNSTRLCLARARICIQPDAKHVIISGNLRDGRNFTTYAPDDPTLVTRLREQGVTISDSMPVRGLYELCLAKPGSMT